MKSGDVSPRRLLMAVTGGDTIVQRLAAVAAAVTASCVSSWPAGRPDAAFADTGHDSPSAGWRRLTESTALIRVTGDVH